MEFLLIIVVIAIGFIIVRAIRVNGESNRKALIETSPDYQSKMRTIRDLINFEDEHISITELTYEYRERLKGSKDLTVRKGLMQDIEKAGKERNDLAEKFHKKYENDPYNPMKIPLNEFPDEMLQQFEGLQERRNKATSTRL